MSANPFQQTGFELDVELGSRRYPVRIAPGLLAKAGEHIRALKPKARVFVVTDTTVEKLHGAALMKSLQAAGVDARSIAVLPGEASKDFSTLENVAGKLAAQAIERGDIVAAFGGGVVGDLAGFTAAVMSRGVDFVQIPTTLLAQVDSSVGGKTGINLPQGKNLVGAFHQPRLVLIDTDVLETLDARQLRAGYAEIVKMALINDLAFFAWLEQKSADVLRKSPERAQAIYNACRRKAEIVARDERETEERMLLNLGHTFGHALEALTDYSDRLVHGEAVAIGTAMAFRFSASQKQCNAADVQRVETHLQNAQLPVSAKFLKLSPAQVLGMMRKDKKTAGGRFTLILARGIGEAFIARDVEESALAAFLQSELGVA